MQIIEVGDKHGGSLTWRNNFLCLPYGSPFRFDIDILKN
jgi:cephalosporin hydroxylase